MSQSATSYIYLRSAFEPYHSGLIESEIKEFSDDFSPTRKGRVWELTVSNKILRVEVKKTKEWLYECEDELLEMGLSPEDAPEVIVISSSLGTTADLEDCQALSQRIERKLNGISTGAKLTS